MEFAKRVAAGFVAGLILALIALGFAAIFGASISFGYPENIRHGYASCGACHISPAGGGVLTPYGRSQAGAFMSTWSREGEENPGFGLLALPDWLGVGGDQRYLIVNQRPDSGPRSLDRFWMQNEVELALTSPNKAVTVAATYGMYGPDRVAEQRRNYLKVALDEHFSVRGGRFIPAFGIAGADHTVWTRSVLGLGQGRESYNLEGAYVGDAGEVILTGVFGNDTDVHLAGDRGYRHQTDTPTGIVGRGAVFLGSRAQLGVSYLGLSTFDNWRQAYGGFLLVGFTDWLYATGEYDRLFEDARTSNVSLGRLGVEIYRGVHLVAQGETRDADRAGAAIIQWFPRPHWELQVEYKRSMTPESYVDSGVLMLHYYL